MLGGRFLNTQFGQVLLIHAGEHGHTEDERAVVTGRFLCGTKHGGTSAGVDGEHLDILLCGTGDGLGDSVRNIVKF